MNRGEIWLYTFKAPDKRQLRRFVATLSPARMTEVCRALAIATGCAG